MFSKIKKIYILCNLLWLRFRNKVIFVRYFYSVVNVGDILNVELVEHYSKKKAVYPPLIKFFKHVLPVGSIIDQMNENSIVYGSGLISPERLNVIKNIGNIKALRGELTKKELENYFNINIDVLLGDFALLFPRIYHPIIDTQYEFGLVLHYVDENHPIADLVQSMGGLVISVKQRPEPFIDQIMACKKIISSSMHGLILSDAYSIPNKRLILSDKIFGGDFKFNDYYSTTDSEDETGIVLCDVVDKSQLKGVLEQCEVKKYKYNLDHLENIISKLSSC